MLQNYFYGNFEINFAITFHDDDCLGYHRPHATKTCRKTFSSSFVIGLAMGCFGHIMGGGANMKATKSSK